MSLDEDRRKTGVADSTGREILIGDRVRQPCVNPDSSPHGQWAVHEVLMQASFPILSYCYSQKGKVLPRGYTRGFLSDLYDPKVLLWINEGHLPRPMDEDIRVIDSEEGNQ